MSFSIASYDIYKRVQNQFLHYVIGSRCCFGKSIGDKIEITKLLYNTADNSAIVECRVVVEEDMVDQMHILHNGCIAYLLDMITALPFVLLGSVYHTENTTTISKFAMAAFAPSQSLDILYSGKASLGSKLTIIAKTVAYVKSTLYVRGEIWDMDNSILVAYANHAKVMPRKPPPAAIKLEFKL